MVFNKVTIKSTTNNADMIIGELYDLEIYDFVEKNESDVFETKIWTDDSEVDNTVGDKLEIEIYFEKDEEKAQSIISIFSDIKDISVEVEKVDDAAWKDGWREQYTTMKFGDIVISPAWEEYEQKENEILIKLNGGMIPKDGAHETTTMCIELVEKYIEKGDKVIDIGTGDGILTILSSKLGADTIIANEIDEELLKTAKENFKLNNIENVNLVYGDWLSMRVNDKVDIVLANIIAEVVIDISGNIDKNIKRGGLFISSGIEEDKLNKVLDALKEFEIIEVKELGKWRSIVARI
ncbi:MAG: hypothetical protein A2Y18_07980 [Clostridiales bacterium GWD2_32_19]|nr:MAG: hypothetical protein A2Y18_07980 [Clostridiales bacterium GWD2_32_19]